jgi:16S rRNA (adenine1518-N6/adenine1519-N6)-dimethyltransferase
MYSFWETIPLETISDGYYPIGREKGHRCILGTRHDVIEHLREAGLHPRKGLGQNFLVDESALQRIIAAANLNKEDFVLEIGAGPGTLTRLLGEQTLRVLAVEIDSNMVNILRTVLAEVRNVDIIQGDILSFSIEKLLDDAGLTADEPYKVVANLPYYITSAILRHLLEADRKPSCLVVTVQEEVAKRIIAKPGKMSLLAVSVQLYGIPEIVTRIPAGAFYPVPKVDSAVLRINLSDKPTVDVEDVHWFFTVVRAGFSSRRKQLHNVLSGRLSLPGEKVKVALLQSGIEPTRRAQTLTLDEWARLCRELPDKASPHL